MNIHLSEKHRKNSQLFFILCSLFATITMLWMFIFNIDIISNAEGQVIPAGGKDNSTFRGGIIDQILVKESDIVKKMIPLLFWQRQLLLM